MMLASICQQLWARSSQEELEQPLLCLPTLAGELELLPEDLSALYMALVASAQGQDEVCVRESGTAMRFMLAYLAATVQRPTRLVGTGRQHQRPIAPLVDALRLLGADIRYLEQEGYPPLLIAPATLRSRRISVDARQSSQYLSALLLIAPLLEGDCYEIAPVGGAVASLPYALMTIKEMRDMGFVWQQIGDIFSYNVASLPRLGCAALSEADWSAASYAYLMMSLLDRDLAGYTTELHLPGLSLHSTQGDSQLLLGLYEGLGITSRQSGRELILALSEASEAEPITLDCGATPDLVPALVASFVAMGRSFTLEGVKHLRIKESNRLEALRVELAKLGLSLIVGDDSLSWQAVPIEPYGSDEPLVLNPHKDHRIAMALAPLMARFSSVGVLVEDAECVAKSFPAYWQELAKLGYIQTEQ